MAGIYGRFCKMAAVPPQTILWKIERYYPAGSFVKPPPRKATGTMLTELFKQKKADEN